MIEFHKMTCRQQLQEVNKAIYAVLAGGQSYSIGGRSLTAVLICWTEPL